MKETLFIEQRQQEWAAWDRWLNASAKQAEIADNARSGGDEPAPAVLSVDALPSAYRRLCQDLSLARDRNYSSALVHSLHSRVLSAHQRIYGARRRMQGHWLSFLVAGLPRLAREEARYVLASAALFLLPLLTTLLLLQAYPDGVYLVMSPEHVAQYEEMYSPTAERLGRRKTASDELTMLAFYIANNVRIDFQCFAGGIAFGLGSIFFLVYNGLLIGATAGYLTQIGHVETFWGFVAGHSAPELIGAVFSGAAGLRIGMALVAPGRLRRSDALKAAARRAIPLLYGAALLTFSAAFIEALWSPSRTIPFEIKIGAGIGLWICLLLYFVFAGRRTHAA